MTFGRVSGETQQTVENTDHVSNQRVTVNQVITDAELVEKSHHLESALQTGNFVEYCNYKIETAENDIQSSMWRFIQAKFSANRNEAFLDLLGFTDESLSTKINQLLVKIDGSSDDETHAATNGGSLDDKFNSSLNLNGGTNSLFNSGSANDDNFNEAARSFSPVSLSFSKGT